MPVDALVQWQAKLTSAREFAVNPELTAAIPEIGLMAARRRERARQRPCKVESRRGRATAKRRGKGRTSQPPEVQYNKAELQARRGQPHVLALAVEHLQHCPLDALRAAMGEVCSHIVSDRVADPLRERPRYGLWMPVANSLSPISIRLTSPTTLNSADSLDYRTHRHTLYSQQEVVSPAAESTPLAEPRA